jgi:hypothetical protein
VCRDPSRHEQQRRQRRSALKEAQTQHRLRRTTPSYVRQSPPS